MLAVCRPESSVPVGLLQSYLLIILAEARHAHRSEPAVPPSATLTLTTAFRQLLNSRITHTHHVGPYAAWLRVTPNHLDKAVKASTGKSPTA